MPRIALAINYNGSHFHGWQAQRENIPTVQKALTRAVSIIADEAVVLHCAGRTDTGVHATKQVVHFDTTAIRPEKAWVMGSNANLNDHVSVFWAGQTPDDFDARHSADSRQYLYLIHNGPVRSALMPEYLTTERRKLDVDAMHRAAQTFIGEQDFTSVRAASCQSKTAIRHVTSIDVQQQGNLIAIRITANAFLHHMVRNIAGVLIDVGVGEREISWVADLLAAKDRTKSSVTAPPNGLFLIDVGYPNRYGVLRGEQLPHFLQFF